MRTEYLKPVTEAAGVAGSGRWAAINSQIKRLCANPGVGNAWRVEVLSSLCASVLYEYQSAKHAYEDPASEVALIAWRARNLLELSVWSIYCGKSEANIRTFYADGGRDVLGLLGAFEKWAKATEGDHGNAIAGRQAKKDLVARAAAEGVESLDGAYKLVSDAAKEVGMGANFALFNKLLSKFAHPTAMQVLAPPDDGKTKLQKEIFFSHACLFFNGAVSSLETQVDQAFEGVTG
jgi:hypothetical protein